jgi:hypothetical protein
VGGYDEILALDDDDAEQALHDRIWAGIERDARRSGLAPTAAIIDAAIERERKAIFDSEGRPPGRAILILERAAKILRERPRSYSGRF